MTNCFQVCFQLQLAPVHRGPVRHLGWGLVEIGLQIDFKLADFGILLPAPSADALSATLYGHFTQAIYRNRPVGLKLDFNSFANPRSLSYTPPTHSGKAPNRGVYTQPNHPTQVSAHSQATQIRGVCTQPNRPNSVPVHPPATRPQVLRWGILSGGYRDKSQSHRAVRQLPSQLNMSSS